MINLSSLSKLNGLAALGAAASAVVLAAELMGQPAVALGAAGTALGLLDAPAGSDEFQGDGYAAQPGGPPHLAEPAVAQALERDDPGTVITEHGLAGTDALCAKALSMFGAIYGAEAGNLALKALALGGVVVAGGIAPRVVPLLRQGAFLSAFRDKGRLAPLMETIPVKVALNPKAPLLGAARVAAELLGE